MGLKLQGILIDRNFEKNQEILFDMVGLRGQKLLRTGKFKDFWNGFQPKTRMVFSFFENASLLSCHSHFVSSESLKKHLSTNNQVAAFFQYDTINAIAFDYYIYGKVKRRFYTDCASKPFKYEEGEPQLFDENSKSAEAKFYKMTQHFLGHRLDSEFLHETANSFEYEIEYGYPGFWKTVFGNEDYHSFWKKTF
jgi:hypothetical protein